MRSSNSQFIYWRVPQAIPKNPLYIENRDSSRSIRRKMALLLIFQKFSFATNCPTLAFTAVLLMTPTWAKMKLVSGFGHRQELAIISGRIEIIDLRPHSGITNSHRSPTDSRLCRFKVHPVRSCGIAFLGRLAIVFQEMCLRIASGQAKCFLLFLSFERWRCHCIKLQSVEFLQSCTVNCRPQILT